MSFARHGLAVFTWLFVRPPSPGTHSHTHSHPHPGLQTCTARGAPPGGLGPRPAPGAAPMRRQPQVSGSARHCTAVRVLDAAPETWGALRLAWPAWHWVVGMRGSWLIYHPPLPGSQTEPAPLCLRRTATSRSSSTKGSHGSQRSATNK